MPNFAYRARKGTEGIVNGVIEAATQEEAIDRLSDQGLLPITVEETRQGPKSQDKPAGAPAPEPAAARRAAQRPALKSGRIRSSEITIFSRQLASLIKAGVPILKALWIIGEQTQNARFKKLLNEAQEEIRNGKSLSSVLARYPKHFPSIAIAMIRTGEDSGTLQEALYRISAYRQKQEELMSKVRMAMAYPILMALTGAGTVIFMMTFVVPRLTKLFSTMGESLPMPTRILMSASDFLRQPWLLAAAGVLVLAGALLWRFANRSVLIFWSRISLKLPVIGDFVMKSELARFARTFELLIRSGVPILRSIEITAPVVKNTVLRSEVQRTLSDVTGGALFGASLRQSGVFPLFLTNLISVGEESGKLDEAMEEIALFYERETDEAVKVLTSLLEPLMILVMGAVVGFIVIAMLLPMFELNMAVK